MPGAERHLAVLLWLGLFADSFGFESLFMQFWKIRENVLDIMERNHDSKD